MIPKTLIRQAVAAALRECGIDNLEVDMKVAEAVVKVLGDPKNNSDEQSEEKAPVSRDESKLFISIFCSETHLTEPNPKTAAERKSAGARWYQPVRRMIQRANGKSIDTMRRTIARMESDRLTISAPQSIENVFEDEYRKTHLPERSKYSTALEALEGLSNGN